MSTSSETELSYKYIDQSNEPIHLYTNLTDTVYRQNVQSYTV